MKRTYNKSKLQRSWQVFIIACILLTCFIISFQIAFERDFGVFIIYILDLVFLVDIYLKFNSPFSDKGYLITDKRKIKKRYLNNGFYYDLFSVVPFELLFIPFFDHSFISLPIFLLRINRLIRIRSLVLIVDEWKTTNEIHPLFVKSIKLISIVFILTQFITCTWFASSAFQGFPENSWAHLEQIEESDLYTQYIRSLYWCVTTLTTIGYGDIVPTRNIEYIITLIVMIIGASIYAYIIGNIASIVSSANSAKTKYWQEYEVISHYLKERNVSDNLISRVRNYFEYNWSSKKGLREAELLEALPSSLRSDIIQDLAEKFTKNNPIFSMSSSQIRKVLLKAFEQRTFDPGSSLCEENELAKEIIFISHGFARIYKDGQEIPNITMEAGDYFGELTMLLGERRNATVKAITFCEAFILNSSEFENIKSDYPEFKEVILQSSQLKSEKSSKLILEGIII